ncbi:Ras-related protein Rab7 [Vitis vinifera]|uniref:Ras-related protein Rab7 n=1 Tax=Vitis vinifera TaxID=29760 RepID=A0A438IEQ0_VITVI|nr:Ras-related protein Rab7 [Vitis vinifera]
MPLRLCSSGKVLGWGLGRYNLFLFFILDAELVSISIVFQANPSDPKTFPFILLGNKIDIDGGNSRVVSKKKAEDWCASKGNIPYFETSAKEDYNVDAAFLCIAKTALANEHEQDM